MSLAKQRQVERDNYYLHPGHLRIATEPLEVTTILGTCVSICLFDSEGRGGINHFLLAKWSGPPPGLPRYGNIATQQLIDGLKALGAEPRDLKAKVFGGMLSAVRSKGHDLGAANAREALSLLDSFRIPVVASDLGGDRPRKLIFHTDTGDVWVKPI